MISDPLYWLFLVVAVPVFWLLPGKARYGFLALTSFAYLLNLEPRSVLALTALSLGFYFFAPLARRPARHWILPTIILLVLAYLAYFKYLPGLLAVFEDDPGLKNILVPLGISYFTFKLIHYAIEVKRENIPEHGILDFFCYIFLAPIFTAGPIERFDHFLRERETRWRSEFAVEGLSRIAQGLIKKLVLANLLLVPLFGSIPDGSTLLAQLDTTPGHRILLFGFLSFLYMYLDFSAYSDIAIGSSRLFGIRIMENFNWPILAVNISVFWKRWHMTLAGWCQSYVYMTVIGLTRNPYLATYLTFTAIGLWHAGSVSWLLWGLYHATGISIYGSWNRYRRKKKWRGLDRPYGQFIAVPLTMAFVSGGACITAMDGVGGLTAIVRVMMKLVGLNLLS